MYIWIDAPRTARASSCLAYTAAHSAAPSRLAAQPRSLDITMYVWIDVPRTACFAPRGPRAVLCPRQRKALLPPASPPSLEAST
ncbi:hypothetical protein PLICRDRAFT_446993 [Plicaturopsis crispa FD-325 SS-3]|uniref:Uncharacterized protein n=1 Tax=Plicaturopsis crispa FD-325 SS-3 TaxID=944288 RepID=A0A0C9SKF3_PLICR|nr:hypothetical protein PLICRDRAFT_446993 [Plicaturopsis crispa FD-325 SS-3]